MCFNKIILSKYLNAVITLSVKRLVSCNYLPLFFFFFKNHVVHYSILKPFHILSGSHTKYL